MELVVNDNLRIINDDVYYCIQKKNVVSAEKAKNPENIGKESWESLTYHGNLNMAYKSLVDKGITMCADFNEVISFLNLVYKKIDEQFPKKK